VFPDDGDTPVRLPYPDGAVGFSFEHGSFVEELRARADSTPGIDYVPGARVVAIEGDSVRIRHHTLGELTVATGFVVGAEGRARSVSRGYLGLPDHSTPLSWMAGVDLRDVTLPFEGYGHVILGGPGPILLYPIGERRARACLDIPLDRCPARRDTALLWRMFGPVLPESLVDPFREALQAKRVVWTSTRFRPHADYGRGNVALIGDAVGFSHPLTAAGLTLGLDDAEVLATSRDVEHYRRQRERPSYVAELLSNALYHVLSREDATLEPIRTAVYRMWGDNEAERRRTMRILITEDYRSASFAAAFLKVAAGAFKHLFRSSPGGDWWRQVPSIARVLKGPGSLMQWPAALLIPQMLRSAYQSRSTPRTPIPHVRLLTGPERPTQLAVPTPRPSELDARVGLASAFGALADLLQTDSRSTGDDPDADWPRAVGAARTRLQLPDVPDLSDSLRKHRCRIEAEICSDLRGESDAPSHLAELLLALTIEASHTPHAAGVVVATTEILDLQLPSGGFACRRETGFRWSRPLGRLPEAEANLRSTALCCRALADATRLVSSTLAERAPVALARARTWILDRQAASGSWPGPDGRPSVDAAVAGIEALVATGASPASRDLRRAGLWLRRRQDPSGLWWEESIDEGGASDHARTARVVRALIAARLAEVDAIERGVNALLDPTGWNRGADPSVRELCDIAEGLAAFLEWSHDLPEIEKPAASSSHTAALPSRSLHA
jgi:2-polyprenyl-6-methoxyphenol hydroxylase-like FAD-dependent oxidoreductase